MPRDCAFIGKAFFVLTAGEQYPWSCVFLGVTKDPLRNNYFVVQDEAGSIHYLADDTVVRWTLQDDSEKDACTDKNNVLHLVK